MARLIYSGSVFSDWAMAGNAVEMAEPSKICMKSAQATINGTMIVRGVVFDIVWRS